MTIVMELRKCTACGKKYSFNPAIGHFNCPHCGGLGKIKKGPKRKSKKGGIF